MLFLSVLVLSAYGASHQTFLEGEWRSNKDLTVAGFEASETLTDEKKKFLLKELGKLTLVFKGNKTRVYFKGEEEPRDLEWGEFRIVNSSEHSFTLSITNSLIDGKKFSYTWADDCFYLNSTEWGFHEYFCKLQ